VARTYRVRRRWPGTPAVTIIIPTRDRATALKRCLDTVRQRTTYGAYRVLIVDNGSRQGETLALLEQCGHTVIPCDEPFNYARLNNVGAERAEGDYLLFLNDDVEVITPGWIEALLEQAHREDVAAVGAKLLYPSGEIQHAGIFIDADRVPKHAHVGLRSSEHGFGNMADTVMEVPAVTGACLMIRRQRLSDLGGFDETLPVVYNDIDLCLRARQRGFRNIYTPFAQLYHHEGVSSVSADPRRHGDWQRFSARWRRGDALAADAVYGAPILGATLRRTRR
jgi:GT2 family glycosyltransferase